MVVRALLLLSFGGAPLVASSSQDFYSLSARYCTNDNLHGDVGVLHFTELRGKVVLIANVASLCGYTESDYRLLVSLQRRFGPTERLKVLAFPCNQFGEQEPWPEKKIWVCLIICCGC